MITVNSRSMLWLKLSWTVHYYTWKAKPNKHQRAMVAEAFRDYRHSIAWQRMELDELAKKAANFANQLNQLVEGRLTDKRQLIAMLLILGSVSMWLSYWTSEESCDCPCHYQAQAQAPASLQHNT